MINEDIKEVCDNCGSEIFNAQNKCGSVIEYKCEACNSVKVVHYVTNFTVNESKNESHVEPVTCKLSIKWNGGKATPKELNEIRKVFSKYNKLSSKDLLGLFRGESFSDLGVYGMFEGRELAKKAQLAGIDVVLDEIIEK